MKSFNRPLTLFSLLVLLVTISILFWLRSRTARGLEQSVANVVASFNPPQSVLGEPTFPLANFELAETLVQNAKRNPFIRNVIVTKSLAGASGSEAEAPIVPFDLLASAGPRWRDPLTAMRVLPLQSGGNIYGHLYLDLDRSAIRSVNWAIGSASVALATTLLMLLARLFSQETTIQRVGSELDQRKRELIRLERLALAGQLTANLIHDLKKPVLSVRHSLEDWERKPDKEQFPLTETRDQIALFFQMLNDTGLERFVKSDRAQEEYVDLNEILRSSLKLVHYERGAVQVVERFAPDLPSVLAQPFRLVQVFSNLILNAYQAMRGKGTLTLETLPAQGGVEILVTDDGPGIKPEILASVFDPFFTTKPESEGSGLGLAISRLIIEELKGKIEVDSKERGPTTFRVRLPAER